MSTDFIHVLASAFSHAVNAAVDARVTGLMQQHANATSQNLCDIDALKQRVAALELRIPINTDLNKIRELIDNKIDAALAAHAATYDHDEYDRIVGEVDDLDLDRFVNVDDVEREIKSALRNATISIEV
jgi:hypothetical protein